MADCNHTENPNDCWWENDIKGIPLCKVCPKCQQEKLSRYQASVLSEEQQKIVFGEVVSAPDYRDVEEQIEPEM